MIVPIRSSCALRGDDSCARLGRPGALVDVFEDVTVPTEQTERRALDVLVRSTDGATDLPPRRPQAS